MDSATNEPVGAEPSPTQPSPAPPPTLIQLALLFLRLGSTAFGGPAAHIAMMEDEVVTRRRWLSREKFLDLLGATNLIPGPNSTEMAIHVGHLAGWMGLIVAGVCFILPAMLITGVLAWAYVTYGGLPQATGILYGVKPVLIAVVVQALWKLGASSVKTLPLAGVALLAAGLSLLGVHALLVLLIAGLVVAIGREGWRRLQSRKQTPPVAGAALLAIPWPGAVTGAGMAVGAAAVGAAAAVPVGLWPIFWFFLKVGSVLFGSGYVLLAFLRADLVERYGWLTEQQLLDAVAVGQVTPGPVFTTATFIGYLLAGPAGAGVATLGIFLPAFIFVALSGPLVPRIRRSAVAGSFLDGVILASLALMAIVTWQLGRAALVDGLTVAMACVSAILLVWWRVNSVWLVLGGAVLGWGALQFLR